MGKKRKNILMMIIFIMLALVYQQCQNTRKEQTKNSPYVSIKGQSFIDPEMSVVLEVKAMNINYSKNWQTCGLDDGKAFSMRIGYANQVRYDKNPDQATRTSSIRKLYKLQESGGKK